MATSGPWVIFEVADATLVESLANEPAVLTGQDTTQHELDLRLAAERKCAGPALDLVPRPATPGRDPRRATDPRSGGRVDRRPRRRRWRPVPRPRWSTSRWARTGSRSTSTSGHAGAREGVVLPELEGRRAPRAVSRGAEPHGRRPHRRARRAALRPPAGRLVRLRCSRSRHRAPVLLLRARAAPCRPTASGRGGRRPASTRPRRPVARRTASASAIEPEPPPQRLARPPPRVAVVAASLGALAPGRRRGSSSRRDAAVPSRPRGRLLRAPPRGTPSRSDPYVRWVRSRGVRRSSPSPPAPSTSSCSAACSLARFRHHVGVCSPKAVASSPPASSASCSTAPCCAVRAAQLHDRVRPATGARRSAA